MRVAAVRADAEEGARARLHELRGLRRAERRAQPHAQLARRLNGASNLHMHTRLVCLSATRTRSPRSQRRRASSPTVALLALTCGKLETFAPRPPLPSSLVHFGRLASCARVARLARVEHSLAQLLDPYFNVTTHNLFSDPLITVTSSIMVIILIIIRF